MVMFLKVIRKLIRFLKKNWQLVAAVILVVLCMKGLLEPIKVRVVDMYRKVTGRTPASIE